MLDQMKIEILPDGTIKTITDPISPANHDNAEQFMRTLAQLAGGETETKPRHTHPHRHHHDHSHTVKQGGGSQ